MRNKNRPKYHEVTKNRFKKTLEMSGIKLEGKVLDLCSGDISIASVYDPEKVVCYEFLSEFVGELQNKKIKTIQGNIEDPFLPFKTNSFEHLYSGWLPMKTCKNKNLRYPTELTKTSKEYLYRIAKEIIRVTKEKAIINSLPFIRDFPNEFENRIEKRIGDALIILNCED